MKYILVLLALLAISEARNRRVISYQEHVKQGGLPLPQAIRDADPGFETWWVRQQLEGRNFSTNIVGGRPANNGEIPYIISLRRTSHSCGGAILSTRTIGTAAHCVAGAQPSALSIRYNTLTHASGGTIVQVSTFNAHENYNSGTIDSDVALLFLSEPLILGQTQAQRIALVPENHDPQAGEINVVSGWGTTSEGGSLPAVLQTVDIPTVSRDQCNSQYGAGSITQTMFCAGVTAGGIDACQGDSGGPYVIGGLLAGLTSWGYGCARPNYAGVAARLGTFIPWINARLIE